MGRDGVACPAEYASLLPDPRCANPRGAMRCACRTLCDRDRTRVWGSLLNLGDRAQGIQIEHFEVVALLSEHATSRPITDVFVHALARGADEVAELLLRQPQLDPHGRAALCAMVLG